MPDFIDKDEFLKDVLPECEYPVKLAAAVERQPIVHIDDMTFKIQNELQRANPSGILEITFVRHGRWKGWTTSKFTGRYKDYDEPEFKDYVYYTCSECYRKSAIQELYCPACGARMDGGAENA